MLEEQKNENCWYFCSKVKVGNDQEMGQSERNAHFKNRGTEKLN